MRSGEGAVPPAQKIFDFSFEIACFGAPGAVFCQEMVAGYSDYNTMFAGQADMLKRK